NSSMPWPRTISRAVRSVLRRSSMACGVVSQMPVTNSTVLRSNSLCTRGFSPISAMTVAASLLRSRVCASTRANSHSTPTVGRGDAAKSMRRRASGLLAVDFTAGNPLAGVAGSDRLLVGSRCATIDLGVLLIRDIGEVVHLLVDDDRGSLTGEQVVVGKCVGGGQHHGRAVVAHLQRGQITTGGVLIGMAGPLEMTFRRREIPLALTNLVDVHAVEPRRENGRVAGGRFHRDLGKSAREVDRRLSDGLAVGGFEVCRQL